MGTVPTVKTTARQQNQAPGNPIQRSYAAVAGSTAVKRVLVPQNYPNPIPEKKAEIDTAKARKITILLKEDSDRQLASSWTNEALLKKFQEASNKAEKNLIAAYYKGRQGAAVVSAKSLEAREMLEKESGWATAAFSSARVKVKTYPIRVYGVRLEVLTNNEGAAISQIIQDNEKLHPGLRIQGLKWTKAAAKPNRNGGQKRCLHSIWRCIRRRQSTA